MTVTTPTTVQDAGLQELRDVARLMLANRADERTQLVAAMGKAKTRLVDPNVITGIFSEEGVPLCDLLAALDGDG